MHNKVMETDKAMIPKVRLSTKKIETDAPTPVKTHSVVLETNKKNSVRDIELQTVTIEIAPTVQLVERPKPVMEEVGTETLKSEQHDFIGGPLVICEDKGGSCRSVENQRAFTKEVGSETEPPEANQRVKMQEKGEGKEDPFVELTKQSMPSMIVQRGSMKAVQKNIATYTENESAVTTKKETKDFGTGTSNTIVPEKKAIQEVEVNPTEEAGTQSDRLHSQQDHVAAHRRTEAGPKESGESVRQGMSRPMSSVRFKLKEEISPEDYELSESGQAKETLKDFDGLETAKSSLRLEITQRRPRSVLHSE